MKSIKISLAIIVFGAIGYFLYSNFVTNSDGKIPPLKTGFEDRVKNDIDSIRKMPINRFNGDVYRNTLYIINEYAKPQPPNYPYGRLGNTQAKAEETKQRLTKDLHVAYAEKFKAQAYYVFNGSQWPIEQLSFIQSEKNFIQNKAKFESNTATARDFVQIQTILSKYNEINAFVNRCNGFSFRSTSLSDRFPVDDVELLIAQANAYLNSDLGNEYVSKCTRLRNELAKVTQVLFAAHIGYLNNKITYWTGFYVEYNSHSDYVNNLYKPIKAEIELLENDIYNSNSFDAEYDRLLRKWNSDNLNAFRHKF